MIKNKPIRTNKTKKSFRPEFEKRNQDTIGKDTDGIQETLSRIALLARGSQTQWLTMNAYLAFVATTLLGMRDVDFIAANNLVSLPIVQVQIDTTTFVLVGPTLGLLLFMHFHVQLSKLWNAVAQLPSGRKASGLEHKIHPWLLFDLVLSLRGDVDNSDRPARRLTLLTVFAFVWLTGPLTLAFFWWRSAVSHNEIITLLHSSFFFLSVYFASLSWRQLKRTADRDSIAKPQKPSRFLMLFLCFAIVALGWLRSEGGIDKYVNAIAKFYDDNAPYNWPETTYVSREDGIGQRLRYGQETDAERLAWIRDQVMSLDDFLMVVEHPYIGGRTWTFHPLANIDLAGVSVSERPTGWLGYESERDKFRRERCADFGNEFPERLCGSGVYNQHEYRDVEQERSKHCEAIDRDSCMLAFVSQDRSIAEDWRRERQLRRANIAPLDLKSSDLRQAIANNAIFTNVLLDHSRFDGGIFWNSDFEGASLRSLLAYNAQFGGSNFQDVNFRGATLVDSVFQRSLLDSADFQWTYINDSYFGISDLSEADFQNAILIDVGFNGSMLVGTSFEQTALDYPVFRNTLVENVSFRYAIIIGGVFFETVVAQASFENTNVKSVIAFGADLSGLVDVTQEQLDVFLADDGTIVPPGRDPVSGKPFRIPMCWIERPVGFEGMVLRQFQRENNSHQIAPPLPERTKEEIEDSWLCSGDQIWKYNSLADRRAWENTEPAK
ncbi:MAG: pentapeptide repeat-containing protein [Pseudomonadota bacterium]